MTLLFLIPFCSASLDRSTYSCSQFNTPNSQDACNFNFDYVCGVKLFNELNDDNQTLQTFINECYACFHLEVSFLKKGKCETFPKNARLCHPDIEETAFCKEDHNQPVCGYFQLLTEVDYSGQTSFKNSCEACKTTGLVYYLPGRCSGDIRG